MVYRYTSFSLVIALSLGVTAQTYLTPAEYDVLKQAQSLPADAVIVGQSQPHGDWAPSGGARDEEPCECWIAPDSSYSLALLPNDDGSSELIQLPFNFDLFGTQYTSLYINNNGNVSFASPYGTYSASPFPTASYIMVAPFWADVDTRGSDGAGLDGGTVTYKITPTAIYVNWDAVGYYSSQTDLHNSFQLILTDGTDPAVPDGNVAYCYGDMEWTTGAASMGIGGFGGVPATVGANQGDGLNYSQIGRFDAPGTAYVGPDTINGVDWLDQRHFVFNTSGESVPPVFSTTDGCDTLTVPEGSGMIIQVEAFPGNAGDQVSIVSSTDGLNGFSETSNISGDFAQVIAELNPEEGDAGFYTIIFEASLGRDAESSLLHLYVNVKSAVGVAEFANDRTMVSPNPATDQVLVSWPAGSAPQRIDMLTTDGKVARSVSPGTGSGQLHIGLDGLAPGAYIVRTIGNSEITTTRLIKLAQ